MIEKMNVLYVLIIGVIHLIELVIFMNNKSGVIGSIVMHRGKSGTPTFHKKYNF